MITKSVRNEIVATSLLAFDKIIPEMYPDFFLCQRSVSFSVSVRDYVVAPDGKMISLRHMLYSLGLFADLSDFRATFRQRQGYGEYFGVENTSTNFESDKEHKFYSLIRVDDATCREGVEFGTAQVDAKVLSSEGRDGRSYHWVSDAGCLANGPVNVIRRIRVFNGYNETLLEVKFDLNTSEVVTDD